MRWRALSASPYAKARAGSIASLTAIVVPIAAWLLSLAAGAAAYSGPRKRGAPKPDLPLGWYDDIFVRYGPVLPLLPLAARAAAMLLARLAATEQVQSGGYCSSRHRVPLNSRNEVS
jgi:hypothetical protein